jgi:hypothetical protein
MMQLEGDLSVAEACAAAQVGRAGFYREFRAHAPRQAETELRDRIQRVALANSPWIKSRFRGSAIDGGNSC